MQVTAFILKKLIVEIQEKCSSIALVIWSKATISSVKMKKITQKTSTVSSKTYRSMFPKKQIANRIN